MKGRILRIPSDSALIFLGALSSVLCFVTAFELNIDFSELATAAAVCSILYAPLFAYRRVNALLCLLPVCLASGAYYYLNSEGIVYQSVCVLYKALHMGADALGRGRPTPPADIIGGWESTDCTELFILAIILFGALIAWSVVREKSFPLAFASTMIFLSAPLFLTITPGWLALMGVVSFWTAAAVSHVLSGSFNSRAPVLLILPVAAALIFAVMLAVPEDDYTRPLELDELRNEFTKGSDINLNTMIFNGFGSSSPGKAEFKNTGDWHTNGAVMLKVKDEHKNDNYYRGNTGAVYTGTGFKEISAAKYRALQGKLEGGMIALYGFQFDSPQRITLEYVNADKRILYAPYYLMTDAYETEGLVPKYDIAISKDRNVSEISLSVLPHGEAQASVNTDADMAEYYGFVLENYLDVPDELEHKLLNDMSEYGIEYGILVDEAIQAVRLYLERTAVYTTSPGTLPRGSDFVEYFLFENKRGYCIHFATSGVLLLRSLGIPARYADGYVVRSGDFGPNNTAEIPDKQAHAWVEVFYEGIGWVPVELTPGAGLDMSGSIFDISETVSPPDENENLPTPVPTSVPTAAPTPVQAPAQSDTRDEGDGSSAQGINWLTVSGLLALAAYFVTRIFILQSRKKAFSQENVNARAIAMYMYIHKLANGRGLPVNIRELAEKAQFSQHTLNDGELLKISSFMEEYRVCAMKERPLFERIWLWLRVLL